MAKISENILREARDRGLAKPSAGMKVPDGYFETFASRMATMLPERPEIEQPSAAVGQRPRTLWHHVRPYVYMAAMFAGVWCMMQMFASLSGHGRLQPMSENPVLAKALANDEFVTDYLFDDLSSWDVVDEMMQDGILDSEDAMDGFWPEDTLRAAGNPDYLLPQ